MNPRVSYYSARIVVRSRLPRKTRRITTLSPFNPVEDNIFADRETSQVRTQVFITGAPNERMTAQQKEAVGDGINQTIGDTDAVAV
jgi:hypothetical protein